MKSDEVVIRRYETADVAAIKAITIEAFEKVSIDKNIEDRFGRLGATDWRERKTRHIDDDIGANSEGVIVAELGGELVGYITVTLDEHAKLGRIPNMAVRAGLRGLGIGSKLLDAACEYMRSRGMTHGKIETLDQNEVGLHLYPKMGFEEIAKQVHFVKKL
jgi:ribosomal protein S18 acetylase RimI-like enzyme